MKDVSARRRAYGLVMKSLMLLAAGLTCALVVFMVSYVLYKGVPNITWQLLSTSPSYLSGTIGILPDILNTIYIVIYTLFLVLPLGVGAAIYLTEYASDRKLVGIIEYAAETLSGIPSIIYGLVGMLFFIQVLGLKPGILAGGIMAMIMCFNNFVLQYYLIPVGRNTLPTLVFTRIRSEYQADLNALSAIIVLIAVIVVIAFSRLGFSAGSLFGMSGGAKKKGE